MCNAAGHVQVFCRGAAAARCHRQLSGAPQCMIGGSGALLEGAALINIRCRAVNARRALPDAARVWTAPLAPRQEAADPLLCL